MAIYHMSISNVSRAAGSASTATLSYISGKKVHDDRTDDSFNYGRKERVLVNGTVLPDGAPAEYSDSAVLFNSIEKYETAANARTAKKIVVALPRECSLEEQKEIVESYIKENLAAKGYAASYAIHTDKDNNNPHAHILIANRQIDPKTGDWAKTKTRKEYVRDENGNKIPEIDPETGKQKVRIRKGKGEEKLWKRVSVAVNPLDTKDMLKDLRKSWETVCNRYLTAEQRIDCRSLADQGIDRVPTIKEGYAAREMEKHGGVSERCAANREIKEANAAVAEQRAIIQQDLLQLVELEAKQEAYHQYIMERTGAALKRLAEQNALQIYTAEWLPAYNNEYLPIMAAMDKKQQTMNRIKKADMHISTEKAVLMKMNDEMAQLKAQLAPVVQKLKEIGQRIRAALAKVLGPEWLQKASVPEIAQAVRDDLQGSTGGGSVHLPVHANEKNASDRSETPLERQDGESGIEYLHRLQMAGVGSSSIDDARENNTALDKNTDAWNNSL